MTDATAPATQAPTLADRIAPHLPALRRYARAITGSQAAGDAHVVAILEAVIAEPETLRAVDDARVGLYMAFQKLWSTVELRLSDAPADVHLTENQPAFIRLGRLSPLSRHALLLTAVEGFTAHEAALVLDVSATEAARLVADAVKAFERQTRARILIIEDEPIVAMDIEAIVKDLGHDVIGVADTRDSAVALAMAERPDLVLADIQLADGTSGIDAVRDILATFKAPVIFVTAFPDRLLTGARPEPTFLISKPFQTEALQATVSQALFFFMPAEPA